MKTVNTWNCHFTATKYVLVILYVVAFRIEGGCCGTISSEYQIFENRSAAAPVVVNSEEVVSLIHCASLCNANPLCMSFSLNCLETMSIRQNCQLHNSLVSNTLDLVQSDTCYVQKGSALQTTPPASTTTSTTTTTTTTTTSTTSSTTPSTSTSTTTTTTTTAAPPTTTVIDMVYGPRDMCPSGTTSKDFLVLTTEGVYVYDEIGDLTIAPCAGPLTFTSIFHGYSSLPSIERTKGILIFQTSNVELYSEHKRTSYFFNALDTVTRIGGYDGIVYKWQIESGNLNNVLGSVTYLAHLGTTALDNGDFMWAAHRQGSSVERHFYLGGDQFFLKSSQHGTRNFSKAEEAKDNNGFDMNPWGDIPTDTVAVTGYGNEPNKNYALVDSSGNVYEYHLNHSPDNNNPTKTLIQQGVLKF